MKNANITWHTHTIDQTVRANMKHQKPCVIWLTGLSGAGKSSIACAVEETLALNGQHTYLLDGDIVRRNLCRDLGFSQSDREENIRRVAEVAHLMADAGLIVLCAFISPFSKGRNLARSLFSRDEFIEVFIDTPLSICEQRDPKGLYKRARSGELKDFTGIDSPYEIPLKPELIIINDCSVSDAANQIIHYLFVQGYLRSSHSADKLCSN